jgi:hypothetical protein
MVHPASRIVSIVVRSLLMAPPVKSQICHFCFLTLGYDVLIFLLSHGSESKLQVSCLDRFYYLQVFNCPSAKCNSFMPVLSDFLMWLVQYTVKDCEQF